MAMVLNTMGELFLIITSLLRFVELACQTKEEMMILFKISVGYRDMVINCHEVGQFISRKILAIEEHKWLNIMTAKFIA